MKLERSAEANTVLTAIEPKAARSNSRALVSLALALGALGLALVLLTLPLVYANDGTLPLDGLLYPLQFLAFVMVGTLIASRRPSHPIGWIYLIIGLSNVIGRFAMDYSIYALATQPGALPMSDWIVWLAAGWISVVGWGLMTTFGILIFPTGRLPSRRWRPVAWAAAILVALLVVMHALAPGPVDAERLPFVQNPFGVEGLDGMAQPALLLILPAVLACVLSVVLRFRQAEGDERQQIKWFAYAAGFLIFSISTSLLNEILGRPIPEPVIGILLFIPIAGLPIAVGIAVLKYRLYDIDLIINRTLVYVPLTAILAGLYSASVALFQRLFQAATGEKSDAAIVVTTLILAASFTPIKNALQSMVDKRFKEAPDATKKLKALGEEVEARIYPINMRQVTRRLLEEAVVAYGAKAGAFHLQQDGRVQLIHTFGEWEDDEAKMSVPLDSDAERVGFIQLGVRDNGLDYSEKDLAVLQQVADAVACAIRQDARDYQYVMQGGIKNDGPYTK